MVQLKIPLLPRAMVHSSSAKRRERTEVEEEGGLKSRKRGIKVEEMIKVEEEGPE